MTFLVKVDGFPFRGYASTDDGFTIDPEGWVGWDDSVEARGESVPIDQGVGDFDLPTFPGSRIVSISGTAVGSTPDALDALGRKFKGILLAGVPGRMTVKRGSTTEWGMCRLAPGVKSTFEVDGYDARVAAFQLQLKFANPRKYGQTRSVGSNVDAINRGNYLAQPVFIVTGNAPAGYTLNGPNNLGFDVTLPVTPGHPHTIRNGAVYVDDLRRSGVTGDHADTWLVPPGGKSRTVLTFAAGASLVLEKQVTDTSI